MNTIFGFTRLQGAVFVAIAFAVAVSFMPQPAKATSPVDPSPTGDGSSLIAWRVNDHQASNDSGAAIAVPVTQKVIVRYTAPAMSCSIASEALVTTVEPVVTVANLGRGRYSTHVEYVATLDYGIPPPAVCQKTESTNIVLRCGEEAVKIQLLLTDARAGCN